MYMVLTVQYLLFYQGYFVRLIQFLSEQMLRSADFTVHALGLVPASTIPRDGIGWHKSEAIYCRIHTYEAQVKQLL